ncbi:hypothetical protein BDP67DRAFT_32241, partial [Colletotrichum lupini]
MPRTERQVWHLQAQACPARFFSIAWRMEELTTNTKTEVSNHLQIESARHRIQLQWNLLTNLEYLFPNDERENDRLDLQHDLYLLTLEYKLGLAPPNNENSGVKRVLDIGTGTGLWAIE